MISFRQVLSLTILSSFAQAIWADGPSDNNSETVRPVPPLGINVPDAAKSRLLDKAGQLDSNVAEAIRAGRLSYHAAPDILIFSKAVSWALTSNEIYEEREVDEGGELLAAGQKRLDEILAGNTSWKNGPGLVVRGYRSRLDDSVQPYGLVIPCVPATRLDVWFHGRGEKLTELSFLHQRMTQKGEFTPESAIVLHPYGRYCNGSRFAGETDFWEALNHFRADDPDAKLPTVVRGFSLGGAACWHIATRHAYQWAAVNPGAGFSETEQFLNFFQGETLKPQPWERRLWNLYDSTTWAANLTNTRTVAYSGEIDRQKQAADLMTEAMKKEGIDLLHIVAPQTAHKITDEAKSQIGSQLDTWLKAPGASERSSTDATSTGKKFATYTLKYNTTGWATVQALGSHWEEARIEYTTGSGAPAFSTRNITALTLTDAVARPGSTLDGQPAGPGDWRKVDGNWLKGRPVTAKFVKKHNLQGPVDDAFMSRFLLVRPTGQSRHPRVQAWVKAEMTRAIVQWKKHFRGDVRIMDDFAVTASDMEESHLILWGDPSSNAVIKQLMPVMPLTWTTETIAAGNGNFSAHDHALILIHPNPRAPERYIVLNSGFTYREYDYLNNARQTPKLPDWAVIDLKIPANSRRPGGIVAADFFDESWCLKP